MSPAVAIITGASQGIGAGLVAGYRSAGYASYKGLETLHPLGRVGEISDVVDAILYLERATFVTGETLHVDGGQAAGR
jgi:NAD(P)-dependent dehydrogenase (short-subunit alcohol dehydrogenase family)